MFDLIDMSISLDLQTCLVFTVAFLLSAYVITQRPQRARDLPPGPTCYPIIGNILQISKMKKKGKGLSEFAKEYGKIFCLQPRPGKYLIGVTGYKLCKEGLLDKAGDFMLRPSTYTTRNTFKGLGILFSHGDMWRDMRKFTIGTMRDLGVGKKSIEERILEETAFVLDILQETNKPFFPRRLICNATSNVICSITFGQRFDYENVEFQKRQDMLEYLSTQTGGAHIEDILPWVKYLPIATRTKVIIQNDKYIQKYVNDVISEHETTFDPDNIRDFIDLYIKCRRDGTASATITKENIYRTIVDLFLAGSETTATTVLWMLTYFIKFPNVQVKCQQEIDKIVGNGRQVTLKVKSKLNYCMAAIQEIHRLTNPIPTTVPHVPERDAVLGGYTIPKGSTVFFMLSTAHIDPDYWTNPLEFNPERWLDDGGQLLRKEAFIPFGLGPRTCLGKILAEDELFLFTTNILQRFTLKCAENNKGFSVGDGYHAGFTRQPKEFEMLVEAR